MARSKYYECCVPLVIITYSLYILYLTNVLVIHLLDQLLGVHLSIVFVVVLIVVLVSSVVVGC